MKVVGAGTYSMRVWLDANKMQSFGLTTLDVVNAIQAQNVQVAAGQLGGPPVPVDQVFQITLTTLGRLSDAKQFQDIIIKSVFDQESGVTYRTGLPSGQPELRSTTSIFAPSC